MPPPDEGRLRQPALLLLLAVGRALLKPVVIIRPDDADCELKSDFPRLAVMAMAVRTLGGPGGAHVQHMTNAELNDS